MLTLLVICTISFVHVANVFSFCHKFSDSLDKLLTTQDNVGMNVCGDVIVDALDLLQYFPFIICNIRIGV